jgi:hypothetical protein
MEWEEVVVFIYVLCELLEGTYKCDGEEVNAGIAILEAFGEADPSALHTQIGDDPRLSGQ